MPRAADPYLNGQLPLSHDPLDRIGYQPPKIDPQSIIDMWETFWTDTLSPIIYDITGINLASWEEFIASLFDGKGIDLLWLKSIMDWVINLFWGNKDINSWLQDFLGGDLWAPIQDWWDGLFGWVEEILGGDPLGLAQWGANIGNAIDNATLDWRSGTNMVVDPFFSSSVMFGSLSNPSAVQSTTQSHSWFASAKVTVPTDNSLNPVNYNADFQNLAPASNLWAVRPGDKFYVEGWAFAPTANVKKSVSGVFFFHDSTGTNADTTVSWLAPTVLAGNTWTKLSGTATVPAGYDGMYCRIAPTPTDCKAGDIFYFDDVLIREGTQSFDLISALFGGTSIGSTIQTTAVPNLPQTQITNLIPDLLAKLGVNVFNAAQQAGPNTVIGPAFEDTTIGRCWVSAAGGGYSNERTHSGTMAFKIVSQGGWEELDLLPISATGAVQNAANALKVAPGQKWYVSCWCYARSANIAPNKTGLFALFTDSNGVNSPLYVTVSAPATMTASTWTQLAAYVTVPTGYDRMIPYWSTDNPTASGNLYHIDDADVHEETAPRNILEQITSAFKQFTGSSWTLTDLFSASSGQASQVGANAAAIARIQAQLDATSVGATLQAKDTFEYLDTDSLDTTTNWDGPEYLTGSAAVGYMRTDGHNAYAVHAGSTDWDMFYRFKGTNHTTQTSYQKITVNVAQMLSNAPVFGDDRKAHICIYGRMNTTRTQWTRLKISSPGFLGSDVTCQWQYKNGGAVTNLGSSFTAPNPPVGQPITLEFGTPGGLRQFRASSNTAIYNTTTDGSSVTAEGASDREGGLGWGFTVDDVLTGSLESLGALIQWSMIDNTDVATVGSYARVYRASTTGVGAGGTGDRTLPNLFDTTDRITSDITFSGGNTFTVSARGVYRIEFMVHNVAGMITSSPEPLLYYTPSGGAQAIARRGPHQYWPGSSHTRIGYGWDLHLNAGDAVTPGVNSPSFTPSWAGDAAGTICGMSITRIPPPLAAA